MTRENIIGIITTISNTIENNHGVEWSELASFISKQCEEDTDLYFAICDLITLSRYYIKS